MSRNLSGFDQAWRTLAIVLVIAVAAQAWYINRLSDQLIQQRFEQSAAVDERISDRYKIATLKRELQALREACAAPAEAAAVPAPR